MSKGNVRPAGKGRTVYVRRQVVGQQTRSRPSPLWVLPDATGGSWWVGLSRAAFDEEAARRFAVGTPRYLIHNDKGHFGS